MPAARQLEPEWLDELPSDDPRAVRSRRDLARVNRWMLQAGIMARALLTHHGRTAPKAIVDLGSGDGKFMLRVARAVAPHWPNVAAIMLDRQDIVSPTTRSGFEAIGWRSEMITADLFEVLGSKRMPAADIITANLFLHHFTQDQLALLLTTVAACTPLFIACEPRRGSIALLGSRLLWAIGCNDVTRHDAVVSVRAGFRATELSALWPARDGWRLQEHPARLFTHCFVAKRVPT